MGSGVVVLVSNLGDKVNLVTMATKDVLEKGIHCGKIIKEVATVVGGGGGGRPDMAQAGGKKPENIPQSMLLQQMQQQQFKDIIKKIKIPAILAGIFIPLALIVKKCKNYIRFLHVLQNHNKHNKGLRLCVKEK